MEERGFKILVSFYGFLIKNQSLRFFKVTKVMTSLWRHLVAWSDDLSFVNLYRRPRLSFFRVLSAFIFSSAKYCRLLAKYCYPICFDFIDGIAIFQYFKLPSYDFSVHPIAYPIVIPIIWGWKANLFRSKIKFVFLKVNISHFR